MKVISSQRLTSSGIRVEHLGEKRRRGGDENKKEEMAGQKGKETKRRGKGKEMR
jgi:hypothetical protein